MSANLLQGALLRADRYELRLLIDRRIGGPGQYDGREAHPNRLFVPKAGPEAQLILHFKDGEIARIEPGPSFDPERWAAFIADMNEALLSGSTKVGRSFSFSVLRVTGSWRGERSGIQISPAPANAPQAEVEIAEHPFVLEFPIRASTVGEINGHRRFIEHRRMTLLLNVLLRGHIALEPRQIVHLWALDDSQSPSRSRWLQRGYFANVGPIVTDEWSPAAPSAIPEVEANAYWSSWAGYDGGALQVPEGLDDAIRHYQELTPQLRARFDRAAFWMGIALTQWSLSMSASFASLVSAIEALTERGVPHKFECPECGEESEHDMPGSTRRFRDFLEAYAPGLTYVKQRNEMYALRSAILHGSTLFHFDEGRHFGWDPPSWNQSELHTGLAAITRVALRNWLKAA